MRHDPDFTRAHPCKPLADYPPAISLNDLTESEGINSNY
jgi:hypothetical protein